MSDYRDFGQAHNIRNDQYIGLTYPTENSAALVDTSRRGQVYQATHGGDEYRLPYMNRSFISFSFSDIGKPKVYIEDFNLIATVSGDRWERDGYTSFNDLTTTYDNLDGQYYWGTHYKSHTITFKLSTDGIDQKDLDKFLHWFQAGVIRELVLSEHPNRAQLARVAEPPQLSLLPFETHVTMTVGGHDYLVTTTLYKGDITLKLTMDEPHWYALDNILGKKDNDRYIDYYTDANNNEVYVFASQDALKILYEDGIPLGSMIDDNMLLGNGAFANVEEMAVSRVWIIEGSNTSYDNEIEWSGGSWGNGTPSGEGARVEADSATYPYSYGVIAGAVVDASGTGISSLQPNLSASPTGTNVGHFFYSGTAPAPTCINFTFTPIINNYVTTPANSFTSPNTPYSTITVGSLTQQKLYFTTPNILTSFNTVIKIITDDKAKNDSWENIRKHIREQVRHQAVRQWAIKVINYGESKNSSEATLKTLMSYFLKDSSGAVYPIKCSFNSETGEAYGEFFYRTVTNTVPNNDGAWATYGTIPDKNNTNSAKKEDIGDMIRSNYLTIKDRNYFTSSGHVVKWTNQHKEYSHYIFHNFNVPLKEISIIYKNMYL